MRQAWRRATWRAPPHGQAGQGAVGDARRLDGHGVRGAQHLLHGVPLGQALQQRGQEQQQQPAVERHLPRAQRSHGASLVAAGRLACVRPG